MSVDDELRPLLFSIAYRMTGSVNDAEEIVQEAFLRLHRTRQSGSDVESPDSFLRAVTTRLCIDHLRSSRVQREHYVGPWLPEPLLTDAVADVAENAERAESLSFAFLILLESLGPLERVAFVLHDVFSFSFAEIAAMTGKSEVNCRQVAARARRHVRDRRPRFPVSARARHQLAERFFAAFEEGDPHELIATLTEDVTFYGDGGGRSTALRSPLEGRFAVGRLLTAFAEQARRLGASAERAAVNHQAAALFRDPSGGLINVVVLDVDDRGVSAVRSVVNPDKLRHLGPVSTLPQLRRA